MLEVNIRYQDDKEKISFITVEGSASIVKSNIVSRTISAVRVEKGADVLLEQTSVRILLDTVTFRILKILFCHRSQH